MGEGAEQRNPIRQEADSHIQLPTLLDWYREEKRDLPWRRTRDPYAIWVSEVMLQQTQVATVLPYFERWMRRFPTVYELAAADEQAVLASWQGLGYYRRAKMLLAGARYVVARGMPSDAQEWMSVPGVGRYTASAISSISLGEPVAVVEGNVERVFARFAGSRAVKPELNRLAWEWASANLDREDPGDWNQALMELGATICRPAGADCARCPLRSGCVAFFEGSVDDLPARVVRPSTVRLEQVVCIPMSGELLGVKQISEGKWWAGMWEFPRGACLEELVSRFGFNGPRVLGVINHTVTHHRIRLSVFVASDCDKAGGLRWTPREELKGLPMPSPQRKALKLFSEQLGEESLCI